MPWSTACPATTTFPACNWNFYGGIMTKCQIVSRDDSAANTVAGQFTNCMITELTKDRLAVPKHLTVVEGDTLHLSCRPFEVVPRSIAMETSPDEPRLLLVYYWTKDGQRVFQRSADIPAFTGHCNNNVLGLRHLPDDELWIHSVQLADAGTYACSHLEECEGPAEGGATWCRLYVGATTHVSVVPERIGQQACQRCT
ncbi:uncharacterized protein LOC129584797 isoform X2 [Paramacrobiotus metropolitanus]|nr:uncharacterized protein LOC129584797 isoform X2 [Paramacrobiotus metropolitanus]XP_055333091.1 uncharacterized protein LOC129584797 isoform X2 [Paramacrobiotus metropolitanus]XP_055333092.1 uncharacterized protein LOC129584797 isoform X2 [Paramacrobiotus metropolitanus]